MKVGFYISDRDLVFGTFGDPRHYYFLRKKLAEMFPDSTDYSEVHRGLNHCLNLGIADFSPFMKPEKGKNSDRIIETIIDFYRQAVNGSQS